MAENNTSGFQQIEVQTNGLNIFGKDMMLMVRYLNDTVGISFCYPKEDDMTGKRTYPKDNRVPCIVGKEAVEALALVIEQFIEPAIKEGTSVSKMVFLTRDKRTGLAIGFQDGIGAVTLYKDLNDDKRCEKFFRFIFQNEMIVSNYSNASGDGDIEEIPSAFVSFCEAIKVFRNIAVSKTASHAAKVGEAYMDQQIMNYLRAIATKVGAYISNNANTGSKYTGDNKTDYGLPFGDNGNPGISGGSVTMATVPEVSSIDGLLN